MKEEVLKERNIKVSIIRISLSIEKGIAASFGGIETLSFNLSSKVKMLKQSHFF